MSLVDDKLLEEQLQERIANSENKAIELFKKDHINTRTEVNDKEISVISRLSFISKEFDIPEITTMIEQFLQLKLSRKRKSRKEYLEGLKMSESVAGLFGQQGGGGGFGFGRR